jgi:hypothetical protein
MLKQVGPLRRHSSGETEGKQGVPQSGSKFERGSSRRRVSRVATVMISEN